jgi:ankyrin repeat protein
MYFNWKVTWSLPLDYLKRRIITASAEVMIKYFGLILISLPFVLGSGCPHSTDPKVFDAIQNHDLAALTQLINDGAELRGVNEDGDTPLVFAIKNAKEDIGFEIVDLLIDQRLAREQFITSLAKKQRLLYLADNYHRDCRADDRECKCRKLDGCVFLYNSMQANFEESLKKNDLKSLEKIHKKNSSG